MKTNIKFDIACCETCGLIITDNLLNEGKNKNNIINDLKKRFNLEENNEEISQYMKNIFHEGLANDKYGVNNLKVTK